MIGKGGFGTVYEIEKENGYAGIAHSALKVMSIPESSAEIDTYRDDGYDNSSLTELFKSKVEDITAEFRLMSKLKGCSNIVSFEDCLIVQHDEDPGYDVYIRMELLTPLPNYINMQFPDGETASNVVIDLGIAICRALELCRHFNIIHRDIKPQNIFVNELGDYKLGDFGVAKTLDHTTRATKTGSFNYMAPEVYHSRPYNASVDLYSLGLVMYWMLNERRGPFLPLPPAVPKSADHASALERRMSGEPLPAPKHGSEKLKRIVLKACAFDPKDRYADPTEMKRDLEQLIGADPSEAAEPGETAVLTPVFTASETDRTVCLRGNDPEQAEIPRDQNTANGSVSGAAQQWKYCIRCGARMRSDSRFCPDCGAEQGPVSDQKQSVPDPVSEKKKPADRSVNAIRPDTANAKKEPAPEEKRKTDGSRPKKKLWIILAAAALLIAAVVTTVVLISRRGKTPAAAADVTETQRPTATVPVETPTPVAATPVETPTPIATVPVETPTPTATTPVETPTPTPEPTPAPAVRTQMHSTVSAGRYHTAAIRNDGTAVAVGCNDDGQCNVSEWTDIVSISAGYYYTVGLKSDGTAVAVGYNENGQCAVTGNEWKDLIAVSALDRHTVGLRADGTVVACGSNDDGQCNVSDWTDIVAVSAGGNHTVGLKKDGTVVAVGRNTNGECDVSEWKDIVMISAGWAHTVGLKKDGTVVAVGKNAYEQCNVSDWSYVISVAAGGGYTLGLQINGSVLVTGYQEVNIPFPQLKWNNVAAIAAGGYHAVALKTDGTLLAAGNNSRGQCNVSGVNDIRLPELP